MVTEASSLLPSATGRPVSNADHELISSSSSSSSTLASSAIDFLSLCHRLKTTERAGWVKRDVKDPKSIADHKYRMGSMALIASDIPGVDRDNCIKITIVHDIAEGQYYSNKLCKFSF
ncbi:hypothetical protein FF1_022809 [Malus domestica]